MELLTPFLREGKSCRLKKDSIIQDELILKDQNDQKLTLIVL